MQASGLAIILFGFDRLRRELDSPGYIAAAWEWLKQIKRGFRAEHRLDASNVTAGIPDVSGYASLSIPGEPVEKRVARLEEWWPQFSIAMRKEHKRLHEEIAVVARESRLTESKLQRTVKDTHLKGLTLELVAVVWLMFGMLLATLPDEVSALLGWYLQ